jgi:predicted Rossmann-fold nucleotide-binding protein
MNRLELAAQAPPIPDWYKNNYKAEVMSYDEFFETITLIQTGKTEPFPVIIMGKDYHQYLLQHIDEMVSVGTISPTDLSLLLVTDDVQEATNHIQKYVSQKVQTGKIAPRKPRWILGEKKTSN